MSWFKKALRSAGKSVTSAVKSGAKIVKSVPVVGEPISVAYDVTVGPQFATAEAIANGQRVDKAVYEGLKKTVKAQQRAAPYAQTIASVVPGVGTGAAAAIGAANALSKGQKIDDALVAGIRGAIPGGPGAQAAFDVAYAMSQGKQPSPEAIQAIPIPPAQKAALSQALGATRELANAKGPPLDAIKSADHLVELLPKNVRNAVKVGIATSRGQNLQRIGLQQIPALKPVNRDKGLALLTSPLLKEAFKLCHDKETQAGFLEALGLLSFKLSATTLAAAESATKGAEHTGFLVGTALHVGVTTTSADATWPLSKQVGYLVGRGVRGAPPATVASVASVFTGSPAARQGFERAKPWYVRLAKATGLAA